MRNVIAKIIVENNGIPIAIKDDGRDVVDHGVYKVSWSNEDDSIRFDLYSSGEWDFELIKEDNLMGENIFRSGRSWAPHSKRWITKLIKMGYAPVMAKAIWAEWDLLKYKSEKE